MADDNPAVGPGAVAEEDIAPRPSLEGASEYEYIELLNPLSVDFVAKFATTRPVDAPPTITTNPSAPGVTRNDEDVRRNYGLNLKNPDTVGRLHITHTVKIPSGKTHRFLGSEAQVVIRQLVNEIMAREGKKLQLADGVARHEVEQRIIVSRGRVEDILGVAPRSVHDQLADAVKEQDETAFPGATAQGSDQSGPDRPVLVEPRSKRAKDSGRTQAKTPS